MELNKSFALPLAFESEPAKSRLRVLVIEDEPEICEYLEAQLVDAGMETLGLHSGAQLLSVMDQFRPDLVVTDSSLPGRSGVELIQDIRASGRHGQTPVIMITGRDGEADKVSVLKVGADDYITKPFSILEVCARIEAVMRRASPEAKQSIGREGLLRFKELLVNLETHKASLGSQNLDLTLTEFKILVALMRKEGKVLSRDELRKSTLCNLKISDRTIDVHMASVRKKIQDLGEKIETVRGVGYRLDMK